MYTALAGLKQMNVALRLPESLPHGRMKQVVSITIVGTKNSQIRAPVPNQRG